MVLTDKDITRALASGVLKLDPYTEEHLQPASIDLPVGNRIWQVAAIPNLAGGFKPEEFLHDYTWNHHTPELVEKGEPTLMPGAVYLAELKMKIKLPGRVWGYVNPKSSTGRIDLYTAVLAEGSTDFNVIPEGYEGKLYIIISPQTFPVSHLYDESLAQLRLYSGPREYLSGEELWAIHGKHGLVTGDKKPVIVEDGLLVHLDLGINPSNLVGIRGGKPLSLKIRREAQPDAYFREKPLDPKSNLFLEPGEFILASTIEKVRVPSDICVEMVPYRHELGEFRSHYAGFFDPGFGYGRSGEVPGSSIVCEIRNIGTAPLFMSDGQVVALFKYEKLSETPDRIYGESAVKSNYQGQQGIALAKYFQNWK